MQKMLEGKKVILFDFDGTLVDSVGVWNEVDRKLIEELGGKEDQEAVIQEQRDSVLRKFSTVKNPYEEYCGYLGKKYGSSMRPEEIVKLRYQIANEYLTNVIDYKPDTETFLKKLKNAGFTLVIATTTKKTNMDIYRSANKNIMAKAPLEEYFTKIYTREDAKEIKPNPEIYYRVMDELQVTAGECLIFEDSLIGIEAANWAGIQVAAMYDKYSDHERDEINARADYHFDSYGDVLKEVEKEI